MDVGLAAGLALTALGVAGYVAGVFVAYPGRSFSLTLLMAGVAIAAVAHTDAEAPA